MGAALIPASPDTWSPYLYAAELSPGLPHTGFTYPLTAAAAASFHAQVTSAHSIHTFITVCVMSKIVLHKRAQM